MTGQRHPFPRAAAPEVPGWRHVYSGKVRDLYVPAATEASSGPGPISAVAPGPENLVLVVASDRISAYDHVLSTPVPDKGAVLTQLSLWWFEQIADLVPNHVIATEVPAAVAGRAMICERLDMIDVECVARGYLAGSGTVEYRSGGAVCGVPLPAGLVEGSRLDEPIFTPALKAEVGAHDENVSLDVVIDRVGPDLAETLSRLTLAIYRRARDISADRGIVLADTKFEFGRRQSAAPDGQHGRAGAGAELVLGDEVLTPDSSRFWPAESWRPGGPQPSFDKQFVRDWLTSPQSGWDRHGVEPPPPLPDDVVTRTRERYLQAYERLTGHRWTGG